MRAFGDPPMTHDFKWRHFRGEIILRAVRWYCRYGVSYRDLEEMLEERGVEADRATVHRWVQTYAPEIERRLRWRCRPGGLSRSCAWTRHISRSKENGRIYIARSTAAATRSTSACRRPATPKPPSGSRARRCAAQGVGEALRDQHGQGGMLRPGHSGS